MAFQQFAGGEAHHGVCDEVGQIAQLRQCGVVAGQAFDYGAKRILITGDEGYHKKQRKHNRDGKHAKIAVGGVFRGTHNLQINSIW